MKKVKHQQHDPEWHLASPRTRKWMVQCSACGRIGYRANAPDKFFGRTHLVRHFEALDLDADGRCEVCRESA